MATRKFTGLMPVVARSSALSRFLPAAGRAALLGLTAGKGAQGPLPDSSSLTVRP